MVVLRWCNRLCWKFFLLVTRLKLAWSWNMACLQKTSFCRVDSSSWHTSSTLPRTTSSILCVKTRQSCPKSPVCTPMRSENCLLKSISYSRNFEIHVTLLMFAFFFPHIDCCCSWPLRLRQLRTAWHLASLWRTVGTCWRRPRIWASMWLEHRSTSQALAKTSNRRTLMLCLTLAVCLTWGWALFWKLYKEDILS